MGGCSDPSSRCITFKFQKNTKHKKDTVPHRLKCVDGMDSLEEESTW
jgi:hypothetical protein